MNYKHLHYFWTVLRTGGIVRASEQLHLTPQTLSGQIKQLEERVGQPLLRKVGRGVEPTDAGRLVMRYADEIFALGASLQEALATGRDVRRTAVLRVGIADSVPKAVAFHVLEPAMDLPEPPRLACHEGGLTGLLGELAVHRLDLIVSDVPAPVSLSVRVYTHLLGRSGVAFFAAPGLLKAFGREGQGVFAAPAVLADEIVQQYQVQWLGTPDDLMEEFYAISVERRITHPAVAAITAAARGKLFAAR